MNSFNRNQNNNHYHSNQNQQNQQHQQNQHQHHHFNIQLNSNQQQQQQQQLIHQNKIIKSNQINLKLKNLLTNQIIKPFKTFLSFFLHLIFHLIQFYLIQPKPIQISSSSTPINSFYLPFKTKKYSFPFKSIYSILNQLLFIINLSPHPDPIDQLESIINRRDRLNNNSSAILITHNSDLNPLTLQLALNFATIGYHVFLQVSSQSQLNQLITRWQRIKSKLNKSLNNFCPHQPHQTNHQSSFISRIYDQLFSTTQPYPPHLTRPTIGTIIPLLYLTSDVPQRLEAISTITAYIRENDLDMISLINIIDPYQIRKSCPTSHSPTSTSFGLAKSPQSNLPGSSPHSSPPTTSTRPLTGIISPSDSDHSNNLFGPHSPKTNPLAPSTPVNYELYNPKPLPLSISSDAYLFDAFGDTLLGPLSTIQDTLLLLKHHKGRIINIWDGNRYPQTGLESVLLVGFQKTNQILKAELDKLQMPISIVYAPIEKPVNSEQTRSAQRMVTNDSRSLLSEASDPDLLEIFIQQAFEESRKEGDSKIGRITSDSISLFNLVRLVLETNYPSQVYPIGITEVFDQLIQLSGFDRIYSLFEFLFKF